MTTECLLGITVIEIIRVKIKRSASPKRRAQAALELAAVAQDYLEQALH